MYLTNKLLKFEMLQKRTKLIYFSSQAGSIYLRGRLPHNQKGGNVMYRISKSALNCMVKNLSYDLSDSDNIVISLHPGWVQTDSGGTNAELDVNSTSNKIVKFVDSLEKSNSGKFYDFAGVELNW